MASGSQRLLADGSSSSLALKENTTQENAQGSPESPETLTRPLTMPLAQEATMGFEPMIRVLQDPTVAKKNLARLWPDSV